MFLCSRKLGCPFILNRNGYVPRSMWNILRRGVAEKRDECWMPVCGVLVRRIPQDDTREKCRISSFLMENLFNDDPMMVAAGMNKNPPDPGLIQYYASVANEGKSIYAMIDMTREIIGVGLSRITSHTNSSDLLRQASRLTFDESGKYMQVLGVLEEKANIYRAFSTNTAWSIECLCTGRNFRRRGIAKLLLKQTRENAKKDATSKILKFISPNVWGSKAAIMCGGMRLQSSRELKEYKDEKGHVIISEPMCSPHKNVELFVSSLGDH